MILIFVLFQNKLQDLFSRQPHIISISANRSDCMQKKMQIFPSVEHIN